jgi:hypothetical protein
MFDLKKLAEKLLRLCVDRGPTRPLRRAGLQVEALEERWCPAGTWEWIGTRAVDGGDGLWSNPNGNDWLLNQMVAPAGQYPGKNGVQNDVVEFDKATFTDNNGNILATGPATLDKANLTIQSLELAAGGTRSRSTIR